MIIVFNLQGQETSSIANQPQHDINVILLHLLNDKTLEASQRFLNRCVCKYRCVCVAFSFPLPLLKEMDYPSCHIITLISVSNTTTTGHSVHYTLKALWVEPLPSTFYIIL